MYISIKTETNNSSKERDMNVQQFDVWNLIAEYSQKNVCAIATGIPLTERNIAIISEMPKYIGGIRKRWRGKGWLGQDCPKATAERVSIYKAEPRKRR